MTVLGGGTARRSGWAAVVVAIAALTAAGPASAVPDCPDRVTPKTVLSGMPELEAIVADDAGRLFFTDVTVPALYRLDGPGDTPDVITTGVHGGLEWAAAPGKLLAGFGASIHGAFVAAATEPLGQPGPAGIAEVDIATGEKQTVASGLGMSNGVERDSAGALYGTNFASMWIERVADGQVDRRWAPVATANGIEIDAGGTWMYATQTFAAPAIKRVLMSNPSHVETYARGGLLDQGAGLDGIVSDHLGRLYVTTHLGGEVWRIGLDRKPCALARGMSRPTDAAFGGPGAGAFPATSLMVTSFSGFLYELPGVL